MLPATFFAFAGGLGEVTWVARSSGDEASIAQRDKGGSEGISALILEHYPGMTEKKLAEIEGEANRRWPLAASLIIHRYGRLEPGDRIVLVATASPHREAALAACHFLIDWLKTDAPFWKSEETPQGERWVEARAEDDEATRRWRGDHHQ